MVLDTCYHDVAGRLPVWAPKSLSFRPEAIDFLADLAQNNERAWFQARKGDYERLLKDPMEDFVATLADAFAARRLPFQADPKRSIFRIYRDTRFAMDKSPHYDKVHTRNGRPVSGVRSQSVRRRGTVNRLTGMLLATLVAACGQPAPSRTTAPSAVPTVSPSPSPTVETAAALSVQGHMARFSCGSIHGCAYFVELAGPGGPWEAQFLTRKGVPDGIALVIETGLPPTLPAGRYIVSLRSEILSDQDPNRGPVSATCGSSFTVSPGLSSVTVEVEFEFDTCAATVSG